MTWQSKPYEENLCSSPYHPHPQTAFLVVFCSTHIMRFTFGYLFLFFLPSNAFNFAQCCIITQQCVHHSQYSSSTEMVVAYWWMLHWLNISAPCIAGFFKKVYKTFSGYFIIYPISRNTYLVVQNFPCIICVEFFLPFIGSHFLIVDYCQLKKDTALSTLLSWHR